MLIENTEGHS